MNLGRSFSWAFTSNIIYAACQWLVLVLIARIGSPQMLGQFTLALALISPIIMFSRLNMRTFQATDATQEFSFDDYFATRLALSLLAGLPIAGLIALGHFGPEVGAVIAGVALFKFFESLSDVVYGLLQKHDAMQAISLSTITRGATMIIGIAVGIRYLGGIIIGTGLTAFMWSIIFICYDRKQASRFICSWTDSNISTVRRVTQRCFPFGIVMLLVALTTNIPVYMIQYTMGIEYVGYYSAMVYFVFLVGFISTSLAQAISPHMSKCYAHQEPAKFRSKQYGLVFFGAMLGVGAVFIVLLFGKSILTLAYGETYGRYNEVFVWIIVAAAISLPATFLGLSLTIARLFKPMLVLNVISVIASLILSLILVPRHGLNGAAWALCGSMGIKFALNLYVNFSDKWFFQPEKQAC